MHYFLITLFTLSIFGFTTLFSNEDSLRIYTLGEVNIQPTKQKSLLENNSYSVKNFLIQSTDVTSANSLRFLLPSTSVRTNSRGESNFFIRGGGERQQAVYFDGMLFNQVFDNRADMSLLPMDIIGGISINPLGASSAFGSNVMGGAITLSTSERSSNGTDHVLRLQVDNNIGYLLSATRKDKTDYFSTLLNVSYLNTPGIGFSGFSDTTYASNRDASIRDNTDRKRINMLGRVEFIGHETARVGLTIMNSKEERGVQSEAHLAPSDARYWRYNDRRRTSVILNAYSGDLFAKSFSLKSTIWFDNSQQTINQYSNDKFQNVMTKQDDKDNVLGVRLLALNQTRIGDFTYSVNALTVNHDEEISTDLVKFSETTASFGAEYTTKFSTDFVIKFGGNYNMNTTNLAGVFSQMEGVSRSNPSFFLQSSYNLNSSFSFFGGFSSTQRFPALREAFSGALNRFVANPELKSETGQLAELGVKYSVDDLTFQVTGFFNQYENLIAQVRLSFAEDSLRRRKRVNIDNATMYGLESTVSYNWQDIQLIGNFTILESYTTKNDKQDTLDNRPNFLGGFILRKTEILSYFNGQIEVDVEGRSFQRNDANNSFFSEIAPSTYVNLRLGVPISFSAVNAEISLRANNIFNSIRFSQLGIIDQNRNFQANLLFGF